MSQFEFCSECRHYSHMPGLCEGTMWLGIRSCNCHFDEVGYRTRQRVRELDFQRRREREARLRGYTGGESVPHYYYGVDQSERPVPDKTVSVESSVVPAITPSLDLIDTLNRASESVTETLNRSSESLSHGLSSESGSGHHDSGSSYSSSYDSGSSGDCGSSSD